MASRIKNCFKSLFYNCQCLATATTTTQTIFLIAVGIKKKQQKKFFGMLNTVAALPLPPHYWTVDEKEIAMQWENCETVWISWIPSGGVGWLEFAALMAQSAWWCIWWNVKHDEYCIIFSIQLDFDLDCRYPVVVSEKHLHQTSCVAPPNPFYPPNTTGIIVGGGKFDAAASSLNDTWNDCDLITSYCITIICRVMRGTCCCTKLQTRTSDATIYC